MSRDFLIRLPAVREAHAQHMAGWSLRALARLRWREWGYASPDSAYVGLRDAMRTLELPVRSQVAATSEANTRHGHMRNANVPVDAPGHVALLAQRRHLRTV